MAEKPKQVSGKEFVGKVLRGEKDFSGIMLEGEFNLSGYEGFRELNDYLKMNSNSSNFLIMNNSEFKGITAKNWFLLYVKANYSSFERADLRRAYLGGANLRGANLRGAYLGRVRGLENSIELKDAIFSGTIITQKEKEIIENALKFKDLFVVKK